MPGRLPWPAALAIALGGAVLAAGCGAGGSTPAAGGSSGPGGSSAPMTLCGTTRTAAGVPVDIEVAHGTVQCAAALAVERQYARALAAGKVPGNGGGAPAKVQGWICRGFSTPQVLATGHASTCSKGGTQLVAVLAMPSASASPS